MAFSKPLAPSPNSSSTIYRHNPKLSEHTRWEQPDVCAALTCKTRPVTSVRSKRSAVRRAMARPAAKNEIRIKGKLMQR